MTKSAARRKQRVEAEFIPADSEVYQHLIQFCRGRPNAIKAQILADKFFKSLRDINDEIRWLRREGILVGSSKEKPYGYYIPATQGEMDEYLDSFKGELFDMLQTLKAQRRARKQIIEEAQYKSTLIETKMDKTGQLELAFSK